jgi:3-oxoacyl-[acyl-carrier-protein] synthase-3
VPDKVVTNADLEKMVDTSDQWIVERTGIRATDDRAGAGDLGPGLPAATRALERANLDRRTWG